MDLPTSLPRSRSINRQKALLIDQSTKGPLDRSIDTGARSGALLALRRCCLRANVQCISTWGLEKWCLCVARRCAGSSFDHISALAFGLRSAGGQDARLGGLRSGEDRQVQEQRGGLGVWTCSKRRPRCCRLGLKRSAPARGGIV